MTWLEKEFLGGVKMEYVSCLHQRGCSPCVFWGQFHRNSVTFGFLKLKFHKLLVPSHCFSQLYSSVFCKNVRTNVFSFNQPLYLTERSFIGIFFWCGMEAEQEIHGMTYMGKEACPKVDNLGFLLRPKRKIGLSFRENPTATKYSICLILFAI